MSENQNRRIDDMSKYDAMTTEELGEILRLDAEAPEEQESDTEDILYIMEVLTERKRKNGHTGKTALEAYESFKQYYLPETDKLEDSPKTDEKQKTKKKHLRWLRTLSATAAVLAIVILGTMTAKAFGVDIWEAVVKWTQETFHFGEWGSSNTGNNLPYTSLQEALGEGNVPTSLVPTWFPDGYELIDITVERSPIQKTYLAKYTQGERSLIITVKDYLDSFPSYVEQSEGLIEEYEVSGVIYYLFSNYDNVKAVWIVDSCECYISGNVTIEELKLMIDSIEKG